MIKKDVDRMCRKTKLCHATKKEYAELLDDLRPHGEWLKKFTKNGMLSAGFVWCSNCDAKTMKTTKFCPECGCDMRGIEYAFIE